MNVTTGTLSPSFLVHLAQVHETLQPGELSGAFLSDLAEVYATLPVASDENLLLLGNRFDIWRRSTYDFVRMRLARLPEDDPIKCRISLFRPKGYGRLETAHTRTLAWLLDPNGEHGFGTSLLAALFRYLSGDECSEMVCVNVESEYPIDFRGAKGRLDVFAQGAWKDEKRRGWAIVIEAKVDALEGEGQLQRYDDWLRSNAADREVFRLFLHPDHREPETANEDWLTLSYLELVRIFRPVYGKLRHKPGFQFLRFYLAGVLQDICGWPAEFNTQCIDSYAVASYLKAVHEGYKR